MFARTRLLLGPPLLATVMTGSHTASYHSGSRSLARVPRNGSNCGSGCRILGPTEGFLLLVEVASPLVAPPYLLAEQLRAAFALTTGAPSPSSRRMPLLLPNISYGLDPLSVCPDETLSGLDAISSGRHVSAGLGLSAMQRRVIRQATGLGTALGIFRPRGGCLHSKGGLLPTLFRLVFRIQFPEAIRAHAMREFRFRVQLNVTFQRLPSIVRALDFLAGSANGEQPAQ